MNFSGNEGLPGSWLNQFDGASVMVSLTLASPQLQTMFRRAYYFAAHQLHAVLITSRQSVPDVDTQRKEQGVGDVLRAGLSHIGAQTKEAQQLIEAAGESFRPLCDKAVSYAVRVVSPYGHAHIDLFRASDALIARLDYMRRENIIGAAEYRKRLACAKHPLRRIRRKINEVYQQTRSVGTSIQRPGRADQAR
jgi:hypothetical protein